MKNKAKEKYYLKNRKRFLEERKNFRNRPDVIKHDKEYRKLYYHNIAKSAKEKNLKSWYKIIPRKTKCAICSKIIYFNKKNSLKAIHFDHRNGNKEFIKGDPTRWLKSHPNTKENRKIWIDCNFGKLCLRCNRSIPTINRKDWIRNMNKYVSNI